MTRYAIELDDGTRITDPDWRSPADVMRSAHGQGVTRMPGRLVVVTGPCNSRKGARV